MTPSSDFIISPHSACEDLYIATCGSFHGYKFLPLLGKYVVEMLSGELDPGLGKRWAWDRELPSTDLNNKWPRRELRDLERGEGKAKEGQSLKGVADEIAMVREQVDGLQEHLRKREEVLQGLREQIEAEKGGR